MHEITIWRSHDKNRRGCVLYDYIDTYPFTYVIVTRGCMRSLYLYRRMCVEVCTRGIHGDVYGVCLWL